MKLQLSLVALSLTSLCLAGKLPVPKPNKQTKKLLNNLEKSVHNKIQDQMKGIGMSFDTKKLSSKNLGNAAKPQLDAIEEKANEQYQAFNKKFGALDLSGILGAIKNSANDAIDKAEKDVPDSAKQFIDIGQSFMDAVVDAGVDAGENMLGEHKKLTVNRLVAGSKQSLQKAMNGKGVQAALSDANKLVKGN